MALQHDQSGFLAGWYADPIGRHDYRYWDGAAWTDQVADRGVTSTDPVTAAPAAASADSGPGSGSGVSPGRWAATGWWRNGTSVPRGAGKTGVAVSGTTTFAPGDTVPFHLRLSPWPDAKVRGIEVDLAVEYTHLELAHVDPSRNKTTAIGIWTAEPAHWELVEAGTKRGVPHVAEVARTHIDPAALDDTGAASGELRLPELCPPSLDTAVRWRVAVRVHRHLGSDHIGAAELTVVGPPVDDVLAAGPLARPDSDDWIVLAFGTEGAWAARVARPDRRREVRLEFERTTVAPGGTIAGRIEATVDPKRYIVEATHARTKRGWAKIEDAAARLPHELRVDRVVVAVECWRGSADHEACHRMVQVEHEVAGALTLTTDIPWRLGFSVPMPDTATVRVNADERGGWFEGPVPGTFPGTQVLGSDLDDVRWRVIAQIIVPDEQFGRLPGHGARGYSGDHRDSPLWAAAEIVVTSPAR